MSDCESKNISLEKLCISQTFLKGILHLCILSVANQMLIKIVIHFLMCFYLDITHISSCRITYRNKKTPKSK